MILLKNPRLFLAISSLLLAMTCNAQKQVKYEYSGGHGCVNLTLLLYTDSSFFFERETFIAFPIRSRERGKYLISDSALSIFKKKFLHFLFFQKNKRYRRTDYRIANGNILLYPEEAESYKDADFIMTYNTLHRVKG